MGTKNTLSPILLLPYAKLYFDYIKIRECIMQSTPAESQPTSLEALFLMDYAKERVLKIEEIKARVNLIHSHKRHLNFKQGDEKIVFLINDSLEIMRNDQSPIDKDKYNQDQQLFMAFTAWTTGANSFNERYVASITIEQTVSKLQLDKISEMSKQTIIDNERNSIALRGGYGLGIAGSIILTPFVGVALFAVPYFVYMLIKEQNDRNLPSSKEELEIVKDKIENTYQKEVLKCEVKYFQEQHKDKNIVEFIIKQATNEHPSLLNAFEKVLALKAINEPQKVNSYNYRQLNNLLEKLKIHPFGQNTEIDAQMIIILKNNLDLLKPGLEKKDQAQAILAIKKACETLDRYKAPQTQLGSILPGAASIAYGVFAAIPVMVVNILSFAATIAFAGLKMVIQTIIAEKLDTIPIYDNPASYKPHLLTLSPVFDVYNYYFKKSMLEGTLEHTAKQVVHSYEQQDKFSAANAKPVKPTSTISATSNNAPTVAPNSLTQPPASHITTSVQSASTSSPLSPMPRNNSKIPANQASLSSITSEPLTNPKHASIPVILPSQVQSAAALSTEPAISNNSSITPISQASLSFSSKFNSSLSNTLAPLSNPNPVNRAQIEQHPQSVSVPAILPTTAEKFKGRFLDEFKIIGRSNQSKESICVEEKWNSEGKSDGYILKSFDEKKIELPQFKLDISKEGKVSASNQTHSQTDKEILAEKMVAAFLAAGNKSPGPINIKCADSKLHELICKGLKDKDPNFCIQPSLKEMVTNQRNSLQNDPSTPTFNTGP